MDNYLRMAKKLMDNFDFSDEEISDLIRASALISDYDEEDDYLRKQLRTEVGRRKSRKYIKDAMDKITDNLTEKGFNVIWENGIPYNLIGDTKIDISVNYIYPHTLDFDKIRTNK